MKKVTVYMPTTFRCDLRPAVLSILSQDYPDFELIIVNDSSIDLAKSTIVDIVATDDRVTLINNARCKGASGARNTALDHANGHFVTGIDDDDLMLPGRIRCMVEAWNDQYSLVFCGHVRRHVNKDQAVPIRGKLLKPQHILHRNVIGNQVLTRLDYIRRAGLFDEALPAYQDFDMWVRLMRMHGDARGVDKNNYIFVQTGESRISSSRARRRAAWLMFVRKHRPWLSVAQRQSLSLLILKEQWREPSFRTLAAFANCQNWRLVALFLRRRLFGR